MCRWQFQLQLAPAVPRSGTAVLRSAESDEPAAKPRATGPCAPTSDALTQRFSGKPVEDRRGSTPVAIRTNRWGHADAVGHRYRCGAASFWNRAGGARNRWSCGAGTIRREQMDEVLRGCHGTAPIDHPPGRCLLRAACAVPRACRTGRMSFGSGHSSQRTDRRNGRSIRRRCEGRRVVRPGCRGPR